MNIALIFNKDRLDTTGCYYETVLKQSSLNFTHFAVQDAQRIPGDFDLFLRIDHGDYKYDIPRYLKPSAFLAIDTHLKKPYKKILCQAKHYDFVFAAQKEGAQRLSKALKKVVPWVPLGCDPCVHKKMDIEKKYDIGFVGSYGGEKSERRKALMEIKKRFPNSFIGNAPYTQMSEIYSSSKMGINYSLNNDINMRVFEILSCGAMLITGRIKKESGFDELFEEGRHFAAYDNIEEFIYLMDYYLLHNEERQKIAFAGYERAVNAHTYRHRLEKMFETIRGTHPVKYEGLKL
ncbi:MAG: glycosyltransferase [Candidatus Omnitrophota bacterium]